jgi:hypothetical protein
MTTAQYLRATRKAERYELAQFFKMLRRMGFTIEARLLYLSGKAFDKQILLLN